MFTRRQFVALAGVPVSAFVPQRARTGGSRLRARPNAPTVTVAPGEHALGLDAQRDALVIVPRTYRPETPAPLVVLLHGAGGRARRVVSQVGVAESLGVIVLAPHSRGGTWDAIRGDFGPDVDFVDRALAAVFERCAVDPRRIAVGGFSDGASYALSLGVDNGDLFTHILAFSPGFIVSRRREGRPRIFVSHGKQDEILPISSTSRRLVPALEEAGYSVKYREFDGPHTVPPSVAHEAFLWFTR